MFIDRRTVTPRQRFLRNSIQKCSIQHAFHTIALCTFGIIAFSSCVIIEIELYVPIVYESVNNFHKYPNPGYFLGLNRQMVRCT
jgi:hypothetical protein